MHFPQSPQSVQVKFLVVGPIERKLEKALQIPSYLRRLTSMADIRAPPPVEFALQPGQAVGIPVAVSLPLHAGPVADAVGLGEGQEERKNDQCLHDRSLI